MQFFSATRSGGIQFSATADYPSVPNQVSIQEIYTPPIRAPNLQSDSSSVNWLS